MKTNFFLIHVNWNLNFSVRRYWDENHPNELTSQPVTNNPSFLVFPKKQPSKQSINIGNVTCTLFWKEPILWNAQNGRLIFAESKCYWSVWFYIISVICSNKTFFQKLVGKFNIAILSNQISSNFSVVSIRILNLQSKLPLHWS
jgi:hypothetical protein